MTTAYRSYLIHHNSMIGLWYITKDGAHISYAKDMADARAIVDMLVD